MDSVFIMIANSFIRTKNDVLLTKNHARYLLANYLLIALTLASQVTISPALSKTKEPTEIKAIAESNHEDCRECVSRAALLFASKDTPTALKLLRSWRYRCPHNIQLRLLLCTILLNTKAYSHEAEEVAREAVEIDPSSAAAHMQYGLALAINDSLTKATNELEKVVKLKPDTYEAWSSLADLYGQLHEDDRAQECASKAASLNPSTASANSLLSRNLGEEKRLKEEKTQREHFLKQSDFSPEFFDQLAH